jgi:uncharacterized protein
MPVTSSASSAKRWPGAEEVDAAARAWAADLTARAGAVVAVGYFGSYARGEHNVGSDLDLVVVRSDAAAGTADSVAGTDDLPVPADVLEYTVGDYRRLAASGRRMARVLRDETVWIHGAPPSR